MTWPLAYRLLGFGVVAVGVLLMPPGMARCTPRWVVARLRGPGIDATRFLVQPASGRQTGPRSCCPAA